MSAYALDRALALCDYDDPYQPTAADLARDEAEEAEWLAQDLAESQAREDRQ